MTSRPLGLAIPLLLPHTLFLLVAFAVATASRLTVRAAEFTRDRVTLRGESSTRTLPVSSLDAVAVEHHGVIGEGYTRTSLQLSWSTWCTATTVNIFGPHDPALAASLGELLGRRVRETWVDLYDAARW